MVDDLTPQNAAPTGDALLDPEQKPGFFASSTGRIVLIVSAVLGFLMVAGIAVAVVMTFFLGNAAEDLLTSGTTPGGSGSTTATTAADPVEPDEVPLSDVFTFRDIFDPLLKPAAAVDDETSDGGSSETSETADGEAGTLYLQNIVVEDGVSKAVLLYNGTMYTLPQGGTIPGTPWQVLSIGSTSVVMLYGDSQISLSVGQGVVDSSQDISNK